jgi:hypothetical protein
MNKGKFIFWTLTGLVVIAGGAYAIKYYNKDEKKEVLAQTNDEKKDESGSTETDNLPEILLNVKKQLGEASIIKNGTVIARFNNKKNWAIFYENNRVVFKDNAGNVLFKADYKNDGQIIITPKGKTYKNSSVWTNLNKIISDYYRLKNTGASI